MIEAGPIVSWINLVEVHYRVEPDHGRAAADQTLVALRHALPPDLPSTARMTEAARLNARAPIARADWFAVVTAAAHGATLLTCDLELIELGDPLCVIADLRSW